MSTTTRTRRTSDTRPRPAVIALGAAAITVLAVIAFAIGLTLGRTGYELATSDLPPTVKFVALTALIGATITLLAGAWEHANR